VIQVSQVRPGCHQRTPAAWACRVAPAERGTQEGSHLERQQSAPIWTSASESTRGVARPGSVADLSRYGIQAENQ